MKWTTAMPKEEGWYYLRSTESKAVPAFPALCKREKDGSFALYVAGAKEPFRTVFCLPYTTMIPAFLVGERMEDHLKSVVEV
jgi:hypothetical protein